MPNFGVAAHPRTVAELAEEAEEHGWDGYYLWDHLVLWDKRVPIYDSFTTLAAIAMRTERLRLGTTVSPLAKSKPWILARQTLALDNLSNGRLTLGVGLGIEESVDYDRWGEDANARVLAEKLDESLKILAGLWSGRAFQFSGKHYAVKKKTIFMPGSVQKPRIPVWTAGYWPRKAPFRRAARWDGVVPLRSPANCPLPRTSVKLSRLSPRPGRSRVRSMLRTLAGPRGRTGERTRRRWNNFERQVSPDGLRASTRNGTLRGRCGQELH